MTNETILDHVDFVNYGHSVDKMHTQKSASNSLTTVIGILLGLIVLAILWAIFVRRGDIGKTTEKETNINLGEHNGAIAELRGQVHTLQAHERADFGRIMFNDGAFYSGHHTPAFGAFGGYGNYGFGGYGGGYGNDYRNGYRGDGYRGDGCGCGHGHGNCDSKFKDVKTFNLASEVVTQENVCNCG